MPTKSRSLKQEVQPAPMPMKRLPGEPDLPPDTGFDSLPKGKSFTMDDLKRGQFPRGPVPVTNTKRKPKKIEI